jgi:uncharacterized protein (TIGR02246 family)
MNSNRTLDTTDATATATALVQALESAWNAADGAAFGAVFTTDADFIDIRGSHHRGRDAIGHGHQAIFDSIYKGSTATYSVVSADTIGADTVFAVVAGALDAPTGPLQGVHHSRMSIVAVRDDSERGWSVRSFHNTLVIG